jgi:hypothetical protein
VAEPKTTYALIKARWNAGSRTRTETSIARDGRRQPARRAYYLISVAEDARFELARRCHRHAFQVCG